MGFSRQEYWTGLTGPPPGDLPNSGNEPPSLTSPALAGRFLTTSTTWEALLTGYISIDKTHINKKFLGVPKTLQRGEKDPQTKRLRSPVLPCCIHPARSRKGSLGILPKTTGGAKACCYPSVAESCLTLCDPMDCSTPGFSVLHYLPELAQTHVHWVRKAIQPFHPLSPPSPLAFNLPSIRVFSKE